MRRVLSFLISWITMYGIAIYWGASYFTEQDGTRHMTVIRDTDFTPSHIIEFYMSYPMYIVIGVGGFMYKVRTSIPDLRLQGAGRLPIVLLFAGLFMIFPNVGLNEWGHTFWFMEELFWAEPLHWMFVFFGWSSLAVFGVTLQLIGRVVELAHGHEELLGLEPAGISKRWRSRFLNPGSASSSGLGTVVPGSYSSLLSGLRPTRIRSASSGANRLEIMSGGTNGEAECLVQNEKRDFPPPDCPGRQGNR